jgi:hypothetical protein
MTLACRPPACSRRVCYGSIPAVPAREAECRIRPIYDKSGRTESRGLSGLSGLSFLAD